MSVKNLPQTNKDKGQLVAPTPSRIDLRNAHAMRRELANVYRDMRCGNVETADGTKLAYVLDMLRKSYETAVLEERINDLERIIEFRGKK
jgi:hypothetical protein